MNLPTAIMSERQDEQESKNSRHDDTFQLYDLHVEVVCPPGERILCGAKPGDYFTLHGEMLYLPPGQGFSIYSLGIELHERQTNHS